jgi:hypothetical protein
MSSGKCGESIKIMTSQSSGTLEIWQAPGHYLGGWSDFRPKFWLFYSTKFPFPELIYSISDQPLGVKCQIFRPSMQFFAITLASRRIFGLPRTSQRRHAAELFTSS